MKSIPARDLMIALYKMHEKVGKMAIVGREIDVVEIFSQPTPADISYIDGQFGHLLKVNNRVDYLASNPNYIPKEYTLRCPLQRPFYVFPEKSCLYKIRPGWVQWRGRHQWFTKGISDLVYASRWIKQWPVKLQYPHLFIRHREAPLCRRWAEQNDLYVFEALHQQAQNQIDKYPPELCYKIKRAASRKFILAYWYFEGEINFGEYQNLKRVKGISE